MRSSSSGFLLFVFVTCCSSVFAVDDPRYRWNLIPKKLLKRLCNLDDTLPICAWKRATKIGKKEGSYSKWQICHDHPELNICRWHTGGFVTVPQPSITTTETENSAEAPPTDDGPSIFVHEPNMIISSKWSDRQVMEEHLKSELNKPENRKNRFEGQLHAESSESSEDDSSPSDQIFDESIMKANEGVFQV